MANLIYSMFTSLDGYTEDEKGAFGWGAAEDEEVHSYINKLASSFGPYLYGRRMYDTMVYSETAHTLPDQPRFVLDFARLWIDVKGCRAGDPYCIPGCHFPWLVKHPLQRKMSANV